MNTKILNFSEATVENIKIGLNFTLEKREIQENSQQKDIAICYGKTRKTVICEMEEIIKRLFDMIAGVLGLILIIPLTIIIYIANLICGDKGKIFYTQERIGKEGKTFKMLKYRSMVVGAEEKLERYLQENKEAKEEYNKYKKLKNDPRITKIGKFLRKTSLDEIPQLLHLLDGKMSLVGPRPYLTSEKNDMGEYYNIIIKTKPGITGLWQVSGRSNATFDNRLDMDVIYYKNKCLKKDLDILCKTFIKVIKNDGAI